MPKQKPNFYREANTIDAEARPIDDQVERRIRHRKLRKRIITAQGRVIATLGEQRHLYLKLEELVADRTFDREVAMFNIGFEHGLVQGRADALAAALRQQGTRGRALATRLGQLAVNAGLESPRTLAAFLEVAWSMALGHPQPRARRREGKDRP